MADDNLHRSMGRVEGKLDMVLDVLEKDAERRDEMDKRLRTVERKSAIFGAVGGAFAASVVSTIIAITKAKLGA